MSRLIQLGIMATLAMIFVSGCIGGGGGGGSV